MKKDLLLVLFLALGPLNMLTAHAGDDDTFVFLDGDLNELADGATVTVNVEEDDFGELTGDSKIRIRNTSDEKQGVRITGEVNTLPSGHFQICFPSVCEYFYSTGSFTTKDGYVLGGKQPRLQAEYMPEAVSYGTCSVTVKAVRLKLDSDGNPTTEVLGEGPTVNINFVYANPTGIKSAKVDNEKKVTARYSISGARLQAHVPGINILKYSDGTTRRVLVK